MRFVNLTPHPITITNGASDVGAAQRDLPSTITVVEPTAPPARVGATPGHLVERLAGVDVWSAPTAGAIEGLPPPAPDVAYIVASMVAQALRDQGAHRPDVLAPGTGPADEAVRDGLGRVVAVTRLIRWAP